MKFLKNIRKLSDRSDEELILHYREQADVAILGILYQRYIHLVYGVCLKYFKNREDSQDAVMQIFEKLVDDLLQHQVTYFRGWLYVVVRHYCIRKVSQEGKRVQQNQEFFDEKFMESTLEWSPVDDTEPGDMNRLLEDCLEQLKAEQQSCIRLFYLQEKCYQEIGEQLSLPLNKVKSYIQNGKRNLKLCIERKHEPSA